jgi:large repetitive protein
VSQAGVVLDPNGIPISTAVHEQQAPQVSFGGTNYFVAWQDSWSGEDDVYGARVSPGGTVLDPAGIPIST